MRVLAACSLGGSGHLQPLVPFLDAAVALGDEVLVIGPPALGDAVGRAGFAFLAGGEPAESEVAPIRERLPLAPPEEAARLASRDLFARLAADAMLPAMEAACRDWRPDLVLREPCEYASAVVATGAGIHHAQVAISTARVERGSIAAAGPALEALRPGLVDELVASPYLTRFPARFDPPGFGSTVRYREGRSEPRTLPEWWGGRGGPLVYVTFGTVLGYMSIASSVFRAVLDAVATLPVRALLTVGTRFDPGLLGPIPDHVHIEPWVDQADVMPRADLVVCHGGSGTVLGALAAGVPVLAVPVFADQPENARLAARAGAGEVVRCGSGGPGAGDARRIAAAAERLLDDPAYRAGAGRVAVEMGALPEPGEVLAGLRASS